jgi:hypothetical protein
MMPCSRSLDNQPVLPVLGTAQIYAIFMLRSTFCISCRYRMGTVRSGQSLELPS